MTITKAVSINDFGFSFEYEHFDIYNFHAFLVKVLRNSYFIKHTVL
jgi:hypothetical protein